MRAVAMGFERVVGLACRCADSLEGVRRQVESGFGCALIKGARAEIWHFRGMSAELHRCNRTGRRNEN